MMLNEKAMLVSLNVTEWNPYRTDPKATDDTIKANGAKRGSGRFNKLLVDLYSVKQYRRAMGDARTFHYANTLPWSDTGARILPSQNYFEYVKAMRQLKANWEAAVSEFVREYPALIAQAESDLGGLFRRQDYPRADEVAAKFSFNIQVSPLPSSDDFRVDLGDDEVKAIQADIEARVTAQVQESVLDLWSRLQNAISHMVERLRGSDKIFRDSLVGNINELTDVLPKLNITGDPNLAKAISEAKAGLANLDPDTLRKNPGAC